MFLHQYRNLIWALSLTLITANPVLELSLPQIGDDTILYGLTNNSTDYKLVNDTLPASSILSTQEPSINATFPLTATNDEDYTCSQQTYGIPSSSACLYAYGQIPMGTTKEKFGDRRNPYSESYATTLPWRVLSADGTCFIELTYTVPGASDMMTASQIKRTAFNLLTFCVNTKNSGGIVKGLGDNGRLQMTIQQYQPQVECDRSTPQAPEEQACQAVLASFPAGTELLRFGSVGTPGIDTSLPINFASEDFECVFKVGIAGAATMASWYDIYGAAVAVYGICGVDDKAGRGYVLEDGQRKFLVRLVNEASQLSLPAAVS